MKKITAAAAAFLAMASPALADPGTIGSLIISAALSVGAGGILPAASACAVGVVHLVRAKR